MGESVHFIKDPDNDNETITEEIPRLLIKSWYPFDAMSGMAYYGALVSIDICQLVTTNHTHLLSQVFQIYYVFFSLLQANLLDNLFCSWLIFACEQLQHLKEIMKPLMV